MSSPAVGSISRTSLSSDGTSRGKLTCMTAMALGVLYWIYSLAVSPFVAPAGIESPSNVGQTPPPLQAPLANIEDAKKYLPHAPWAGDARHHYRTLNSIVFAEKWTPKENDNAVLFEPFAMVWMQKGRKPDEQPITIIAESAYVKFANKFDTADPNPGRVIGGALRGRVEIRGPNNLSVIGKHFVFSEKSMRIWSDSPVVLAYGPHRGKAVGLQCDLLKPVGATNPDKLAVGGIQTVRLQRNVALNLVFEPKNKKGFLGRGAPENPNTEIQRHASKKKPTIVKIRSAGSFEFGVQSHIATFEDDVKVFRPTKLGKFDVLMCGVLTLLFEPEEKSKVTGDKQQTPEDPNRFRGMNSKLAFRRMRAQPDNGKRHVILQSEVNNLIAYMDDLIYDGQTRLAVLTDRETVQVIQDASETRAPKITLQQDQKGTVSSIWCDGAGSIKHKDIKTGRLELAATWKKRLRKIPDPNSDLDIVDLEEDAVLQQPDEKTDLKAQFIRLWMDRRKKKNKKHGPQPQPIKRDGRSDKDRVKLRRMLAINSVELNSPDMLAHTRRLEVWFESAAEHPSGTQSPRSRREIVPALRREVSQSPLRRKRLSGQAFASVDGPAFGTGQADEPKDKKSPFERKETDGPLEIWSDLIRVLVVQKQNDSSDRGLTRMSRDPGDKKSRNSMAREVWTLGNVRVQQTHAPGEEPLRITGEKMHIDNRAENDQLLHIYGKPAHIRDRLMHIEGEQIHLDRSRNRSWVDGKGLLQLPVEKMLDGRKLAEPQLLDIWWKKNMEFDGGTAKFRGKVRAVVEDSRVRCEELDVFLSKRISFTDRKPAGKPDVERIECRDNVEFESYEYQKNKLIQIRKGRINSLVVYQQTGRSEAQGPGWFTLWRFNTGKRPRLVTSTVQANQSATKKKHDWEYTRIDFAGTAVGNFREGYNRFKQHVQVVYGPVDRLPHVVDPDNLPKDGGWLRSKELVAKQYPKTKTRAAYMTLAAEGNAEVDGRGFHGRADRITFNESQDLYVLHSQGRENATIWRQTKRGGPRNRADARRMEFIPSQNRLKLEQTRTLDGVR